MRFILQLPLILGSSSPRRKEILDFFNIPFLQVCPDFDESSVEFKGNPAQYVMEISEGKATSLKGIYPNQIILTADTIVYKSPSVYLKPNDEKHAYYMLKELQGSYHQVYTSITICLNHKMISDHAISNVLFNKLNDSQIKSFLSLGAFKDKSGSYFIQGSGSLLVNKIDGCFYNVMGLPVNLLYNLLKQFNIDLWNYLHV
jgi:septum formation protein